MKTITKTIILASLLSGSLHAAITISGTLGLSFKADDLSTNIPTGALAMVIVDTDADGFLNLSDLGAVTPGTGALTTTSDPGVAVDNAGITAGGTFGGDYILSLASVTSGSISNLVNNVDITSYTGMSFAVIWFTKSAATLTTEGLASQYFGIIRGADWLLPGSNTGSYSLSATDGSGANSYYSFSATVSTAQVGASGFFTGSGTAGTSPTVRGATFQIIPEPSSALLGALGALALLRRRRN